jgi:hypothetical protein
MSRATWAGTLRALMARSAGSVCLAVLVLGCFGAKGSSTAHPLSFENSAKFFVNQWQGDPSYPLLFVGKAIRTDSANLPCTVQNSRQVTWLVSRVLEGFDPGNQIQLLYGGCGTPEPKFSSPTEMLVLSSVGHGQKELVVPATEDNIRQARRVLDTYLRERIKKFVGERRGGQPSGFFVFDGTLVDPGPKRDDSHFCFVKEMPTFSMGFNVEQVLSGEWDEKQASVRFNGCGLLDPYRPGQRMVVFADVYGNSEPVELYARFLVPPNQMPQVRAALNAALKK